MREADSKLTLLHIFLFETPLTFTQQYSADSIISIMRSINEKVDELMQNKVIAYFVNVVRQEGNIPY